MKYLSLIVLLITCSFSFGKDTKISLERNEASYSKARYQDAKAHLSYVINHLKEEGQLSSSGASGIWKIINNFKILNPSIGKISENLKLSKKARKILTRSIDGSLGLIAKDDTVFHDPEIWLQEFSSSENSDFERRTIRAIVYEQTKTACINGFNVDSKKYQIDAETIEAMQKGTFVVDRAPQLDAPEIFQETEICVVEADTIDAAYDLCLLGYKPVALNFANQNKVGGGVVRGAQAQEESLFLRTSYFLGLDIHYNQYLDTQMQGEYLIPEFGAVYTPSVTVIRGKEKEGYPFIAPFQIDFIASAAYDLSKTPFSDITEFSEKTKEKIRTIMRLSFSTNHDSVVLGAFGCGAFRNPVDLIVALFSEVLSEQEFQGQFKNITFAILNGAQDNKLQAFQAAFHKIPDNAQSQPSS